MIQEAIASNDPVMFFEPKSRYWQRGEVDRSASGIGLHRSRVIRTGTEVTVVGHGAMVAVLLQAAEIAATEGTSIEVIDLRSLSPVDWEAIEASARKTSKVLVLTEDSLSWGYGAELAARIGESLYTELDGPVRRLAATDTFVPYAPELEDFVLPQVADILKAVRELAAW